MRMAAGLAWLSTVTLALSLAAPAQATTMRPLSLESLTLEAHSVVRGTVVGEEVVWDASRRTTYTHTFVEVSEVLWGRDAPGDIVVVRQIGGTLDGVTTSVVGTARLELGAEVVLFNRTDGAFHYLVGMAQGAYGVIRDATGAVQLARGTTGLAFLPSPLVARPPAPDRLTLDALRTSVRSTLRDAGRLP